MPDQFLLEETDERRDVYAVAAAGTNRFRMEQTLGVSNTPRPVQPPAYDRTNAMADNPREMIGSHA